MDQRTITLLIGLIPFLFMLGLLCVLVVETQKFMRTQTDLVRRATEALERVASATEKRG